MKATAIQPSRIRQATGHIVIEASKDTLEAAASQTEKISWPKSSEAAKSPTTSTGTQDSHPKPATKKAEKEGENENPKAELKSAIEESNDVLMSAKTVFPFTLFRHTMTIDRAKITICHRRDFFVSEKMSIRIEDVLNVTATVGPFFGSIQISIRVFNNDAHEPYIINYLWRHDALRFKRIIQGYIIALQKEIDCSNLPTRELTAMLEKLGEDDHPNT